MAPEIQQPHGSEIRQVRQRFDLARIIESEAAEADIKTALCEWIDNSLDQTLNGKPCEILISFDAGNGKLDFENKNTPGMQIADYESFLLWGQSHANDERIYAEHGQGGKLAIVQLLDKVNGNLEIVSQGCGVRSFTRMEILNWWKQLEQNKPFDVITGMTELPHPKGFTHLTLTGLKDKDIIPSNFATLADELGHVYSNLITEKKLAISVRRISKGGTVTKVEVLPVTLPLAKNSSFEKEGVQIRRGSVKYNIKWGMLDSAYKEADKKARASAYNVSLSNVMEPDGLYVYIRNRGRLHGKIPLAGLRIARTGRYTLSGFVAEIDITDGVIDRTLLKKNLSPTSPVTAALLDSIRQIVSPYIHEAAKEADVAISVKDAQKVKEASSKFGTVLLGLFANKQSEIVKEFFSNSYVGAHLIGDGKIGSQSSHSPNYPTGERNLLLPGSRSAANEKGVDPNDEKKFNVRRIQDAIPELRVETYGGILTPVARLAVDTSEGRNVLFISMNFDNPEVRWALQARGDVGIAYLIKIGAEALYHEKWIAVFPKDSELYKQGIEEDVAKFLKKAGDLKLLKFI